ncbi:transposase InsO [Desulfuromonas soudanensis]|uniref:Transposase InsO n=1 Tax=Desulfuromonas soudanensis TaxID=1603606 RepID=A0A0M4CYJ3_9BACT|nr:integrase core domain-containing protein [Desulfuromonas soudanensis]ALC15440.1 transposase InsO [Desulfuromonas soudanensis]
MPWEEVKPMDQKLLFIADHLREVTTFSELCHRYSISRKTGYKWVARYKELGLEGLSDHSRRPLQHPWNTPHAVRKAIIELRTTPRDSPGPKKIRVLLEQNHPDWDIPSKTTIYKILVAEGLVHPQRRRKRVPAGQLPFSPVNQPNDVWSADFKGQFKTMDGTWCYPLTVMDHQSRFLLDCRIFEGTRLEPTKKTFETLFREYGLPWRIRTDNGVPFASLSVGGLSQLSKWWIRLGIMPERIEPGKPQQNGQHERMHKTLKEATAIPPARTSELQQQAFDDFRNRYNNERPHESLGQKTPASLYIPSIRTMPDSLPELEYPGHFKVVQVQYNGIIYHQGHRIYIACLLQGERVGIEEIADGVWNVFYGFLKLGSFDMRQVKRARNDYLRLMCNPCI